MLTDAAGKHATCPTGKGRARLACSGGLYLEISPAGSKRWFWKYRKDGKEARMALGSYPDVGAKDARKARDAAKSHKSDGRDPVQVRKVEKLKALTPAGDTFKATTLEWYAMELDSWSSHYAIREKRNLEKDLFPFLGERNIGEIEAIELLATVRRVEERGAFDVAHRVLTTAGQVWRYAVATGRAQRDVSADIRGALKPHHGKHFAAITDPVKLGELIRVIRGYQGGAIVRAAPTSSARNAGAGLCGLRKFMQGPRSGFSPARPACWVPATINTRAPAGSGKSCFPSGSVCSSDAPYCQYSVEVLTSIHSGSKPSLRNSAPLRLVTGSVAVAAENGNLFSG